MAEGRLPRRGAVALAGAAVVLLALGVLARGPVALLAVATTAVGAGLVLGVLPLLRDDGVDWGWRPDLRDDVAPEPVIATLRGLLAPTVPSAETDRRLQDLLRAIADDRLAARARSRPGGGAGGDPSPALATYLAGPPRRLDLAEIDQIVTDLETITAREAR